MVDWWTRNIMYECEIGQGLPGNSVPRAMGGAVQNATLPINKEHSKGTPVVD